MRKSLPLTAGIRAEPSHYRTVRKLDDARFPETRGQILGRIATLLGLAPSETLVVGDEEIGFRALMAGVGAGAAGLERCQVVDRNGVNQAPGGQLNETVVVADDVNRRGLRHVLGLGPGKPLVVGERNVWTAVDDSRIIGLLVQQAPVLDGFFKKNQGDPAILQAQKRHAHHILRPVFDDDPPI